MRQDILLKKILTILITTLLILVLFLDYNPPATAVYLTPGKPNNTSVIKNTIIIFENVNLTIRGAEKIPIDFLNFTIFNLTTGREIAYVKFHVNGTKIEESPIGKFEVKNKTIIYNGLYGYGYRWGYDEREGVNYSYGYGYGYGYGDPSYEDVTFLYDITYITHKPGKFYAKLFVNSISHIYASDASITFTVSYPEAPPADIYVDINNTEGPWDGTLEHPYRTIQKGIDAVRTGGTVYVFNGTYRENIVITKSLTLHGAGSASTTIESVASTHVIYVRADNVNITGFTIKKAEMPQTAGICLYGAKRCHILNNNVVNNQYGIWLKTSSNDNNVTNNNVSSNIEYGIYLTSSSNNNIIIKNKVFSNANGIFLFDVAINTLTKNNVSKNKNGIYLTHTSTSILTKNNAFHNDNGIYLEGSSANTLLGNKVCHNENGIYLEGSSENNVKNNSAFKNTDGISLLDSSINNISNNSVFDNKYGISLLDSSTNTLRDNTISNNTNGIYLYFSYENLIYNNYFDNINNAWDNGRNQWNVSIVIPKKNIIGGSYLGGNFWHDYNGKDMDGDGLGNTLIPYNSSGEIAFGGDYYPLTTPHINNPPSKPTRPLGPTAGKTGTEYSYVTVSTDPDGDKLYYKWDWGDGTVTRWQGPYTSGVYVEASHTWYTQGSYKIRVKTKDEFDVESPWSDPLSVSIPKGKHSIKTLLQRFIERLLERFSTLAEIFQIIKSFANNFLSYLQR